MRRALEQGILKYLATLAMTFSAGLADAAPTLANVPAQVLEDVVDVLEDTPGDNPERGPILSLLAEDPRPQVRARVADTVAAVKTEELATAHDLLQRLAGDSAPAVRQAAAIGLARVLERLGPLERIEVVAQWATCSHTQERAAIATALCYRVPALGADLAIELLAQDDDIAVRRLAVHACAARWAENPPLYGRLIQRLMNDPAKSVRRSARRVVRQRAA